MHQALVQQRRRPCLGTRSGCATPISVNRKSSESCDCSELFHTGSRGMLNSLEEESSDPFKMPDPRPYTLHSTPNQVLDPTPYPLHFFKYPILDKEQILPIEGKEQTMSRASCPQTGFKHGGRRSCAVLCEVPVYLSI